MRIPTSNMVISEEETSTAPILIKESGIPKALKPMLYIQYFDRTGDFSKIHLRSRLTINDLVIIHHVLNLKKKS